MAINVALHAIQRKAVECLLNLPLTLECKRFKDEVSFFMGYRCVEDKLALA